MGSTLALRLAFLALGKQADVICDGDMPDNLKYLPGSEAMLHPKNVNGADYDTAIAVDVNDRSLLGKSEAVFDAAGFRMVIDHQRRASFQSGEFHPQGRIGLLPAGIRRRFWGLAWR